MRILLVEDDRKIAGFIERGLREEGCGVDVARDGDEGFTRAATGEYDLVVLDLLLPRRGGLEVCRHLREQGATVPILMLTAKDALDDKVEGLGSGADDYLTKPFAFEELLARIRALLRRSRTLPPPVLRVGDLVLDPASRTVTRGGRRIELTTREFQLLSLLMRHPGQVLSRTLLLSRIWGYDFDGHTNVVEAYIRLLRRKIDAGERVPLIHTVRGAGYVLRPPSP